MTKRKLSNIQKNFTAVIYRTALKRDRKMTKRKLSNIQKTLRR